MALGKGDPNIPEEFFEFDVEEIRTMPRSKSSGVRYFMVRNKLDTPRYDYLIDATVSLDGELYIVEHVELEPDFRWSFNRVGELIGLKAKKV